LIVVDASALIAIAQFEPDRRRYQEALAATEAAYLSPSNYLETGIILIRRRLISNQARLDLWLESLRVELREDVELGPAALEAYLRFGKGFHAARLNLADCFAYALAHTLDLPLLYKGDDFAKTDIRSAI
jgi:ribonuclease VapC